MKSSFLIRSDPDRLYQLIFRRSVLKKFMVPSKSLGLSRTVYVYFPVGYENLDQRLPVLYLFRNHESEWINRKQDASRQGRNMRDVLDDLIRTGKMKPLLVVMPGLGSLDNHIPGLGVNFAHPALSAGRDGIGTGRFEDFLTKDLVPWVDRRFRTLAGKYHRGTDGFSLGGYTAIQLALRHPDLFHTAGSFDGTHMWLNFRDPRGGGGPDKTWLESSMFEPAFGKPFSIPLALDYNASNLLTQLSRTRKKPDLKFLITCVNREPDGNRDRALHLLYQLDKAGYRNELPTHVLDPDASHNWYWADRHLALTAPVHSRLLWEKS